MLGSCLQLDLSSFTATAANKQILRLLLRITKIMTIAIIILMNYMIMSILK